ncbi:type II toxin-antitoxin system HicA family toxin [Candidatus Kapabacteria bacterium]|nr:type II toxin-antitoxin system HicA family toxin [Candidatus Kapabacteria bacterium]
MKPRELIKKLEKDGFVFIRQKGSHSVYFKKGIGNIIVPIHSKDIPTGTLNAILKDSGLKD